ncbi:hypothetical protein DW639_04050 [Megamonas funiformis]|uniref:YadA-like family protein n=1 Tax=Megamonas funiformis TaxID=437897 RepID=UPI000E498C4F|nr:YadA-like family protein [Megamonas funiformis]RHG10885.1 hypothetical protein DW639_04050 [Megamonas funiformis]
MASNKKAQILAAVMCASSIFGSYTVVSAADTPTKIESTDKNSSVTANGSTITATAGAQGSQQSTITLGNKSLAINVGKQTTTDGITYGAFTLNSSNLAVNNSGLSVKNTKGIVVGSISNTGAITGTGLTIKNGTGTTLASLNNNGLNIYDGINTKATATITKAGAITGTGLTVKAVSDTIKPEGDYVESKVTSSGVADTIKQGGFTRATSNVAINSIKDTIYTNDGKELSSSNISKSVSDATESGSVTLIANKITTNDDATTTTLTSKLNLTGDSATLTSGSAYVKADNTTGNVLFSGNNATLSGSTFTLKDGSNNTARLTATGLSFTDASGQPIGGVSSTGAITGTSLNITAKNTAGNKTTSTVGATGVTDTVYGTDGKTQVAYSSVGTGGISNTTSLKTTTGKIDTAINQNTSGVGISSTKYDTNNNVTDKTSVSVNGGTSSITSYGNYVYGEDGKATSYNQASMSLNGNTGIVTIKGGSNSAYSTLTLNEAGVALSGKNASLSGSTFTLKDTTNGKTLASLGASGLSINNADGIKVGGISNTGNLIANDGMNVTDKNSSWVNIGTSTMQKDIVATTTTSYAGITNKIDTTLAGNKTYTSGTVVGPTSVTTTVQGSNTTDAISGNKNKTTSTVSATGVTDTVYNVKGNQVASSSVTTNGIVNTTTNLSIDGSTNNTMNTSIYQDKRGISASATKKDENGTVGTSTLTLAGNSASLKVGNYGFAVDSNNNVSIAGNNATLSGSTFTLKDANGKTATLNTSGLTLKDEDGNTTGGISSTGAITGTSLRITTSEDTNGNKTVSTVATNGVTDTVTNNKTNNKTTSQVSANGVTDTVYGTDETTKVAYSSVGTGGISNTTSLKTTTGKIDTAINQNKSGVSISSTAYSGQNLRSGNSSVSVNGAKTTISSSGGYEYSSDGEVLKYNTASLSLDGNAGTVGLSGKNVSLTNTDLTLKNVETGKAYVKIGSNGLNIYNDEGTSVFGVTRTGAINIDKNVTIDDSYTKDGYTYTASNSISGSNGIRNVATKKDESGKTIATSSSTVTTSGITNSTNISGIAIKDDKNNTKTMNTSIAQNANGVSISSTKYNVYSDGTNTIQTTDGTSSISVNGAKTTISGYGSYEYERDESGKLVVSSRNSASLSVDGESGIIGLSGKNVGLSANGLTLYKDVDGVKTQYASLSAGGLDVKGTGSTTIKSTNATTGAMGQSQVSYNGVTDTVTNAAGNKTTSQVSANGVTDTVYGTDGTTKVASSSVSTSGISNTTSLKTTTGKIDTAINQNTSGVGISSTKYDTNNNVTDKTSVSVNGGTSSITSYGSYIYGEDGKATSYNQASISLNGNTGTATIRGGSNTASSTLTLNEAGVALSGKNVGLNANGLTLYKDVEGVKTQYASLNAGGLNVNGTSTTTIKSTNATTGAMGQSQVSYNGVTDSFTKDDVTNSVTTNANGTTFSSTGNGSTTIKGDTIKTTNLIVNGKDIGGVATDVAGIDRNTENEDGLGYYTQIEGKTKIYNTGRFSTANGNFVVDPYGSITSKAGNYRFNMDRTSGFDLGYAATTSFTLDNTGVSLGFRNNSFILDKNGATFINANGENVSFTSINGGTITTGETVINGSSITTKDLYVDNIHLNGAITDDNGNVVGGGDLSLGADGTLDLKYNANGITNTFVSGATGVHSSFSNGTTTASSSVGYIDDKNTIGIKDQVGNTSVTTTTDGTTFANGSGSTTINGGNITTTGDVTVGGDLSVGDNFKVDGTTGNVTGGTYNGVQISTDKDGNAIIGGTNIGDLATNEEVNKVNDKVDAVDNKVGDTSKLDKEITDNQNYKDNQNLVGAVNAEADIRRNEISRIDGQIEQLDGRVGSLENRMSDVEDRIDKVGAMSAAIANLRTMGFDPEAPTEIAIGVGQYKSETGLALGVFHYPNQDFMLSASISTSGDEVMGGIGATWKLGRKSAAEKAKDEEARRLEKAEEMKKLAQDAKVKAQAERHAKLLTEREAQKTA